ncbi:hypothetical protein T484DRAFT_1812298, partial [Baffinella frigidus]
VFTASIGVTACASSAWVSESSIVCTARPGIGTDLPLSVVASPPATSLFFANKGSYVGTGEKP